MPRTYAQLEKEYLKAKQSARFEIEGAILAALTHHKPDYRSLKRLEDAARIIADFVIGALRDRILQ